MAEGAADDRTGRQADDPGGRRSTIAIIVIAAVVTIPAVAIAWIAVSIPAVAEAGMAEGVIAVAEATMAKGEVAVAEAVPAAKSLMETGTLDDGPAAAAGVGRRDTDADEAGHCGQDSESDCQDSTHGEMAFRIASKVSRAKCRRRC